MSGNKSKRRICRNSDPGKTLELVMSLTDDSCALIQTKINIYLKEECNAESVFQIVVNEAGMEAHIEAVGSEALPKTTKIYMDDKLQAIIKTGKEQNNMLSDFAPDLQSIVSPLLSEEANKRVIMYPILDKPFSVIVCVVAPKQLDEPVVNTIKECFLLCWPVLKKSICLVYESTLKTKCQQLLGVARQMFTQVASLETLLKIAIEQARRLTKAEYCSVLLIDVNNMELVDSCSTYMQQSDVEKRTDVTQGETSSTKRRFPLDKGIVGEVIRTGNLINTKDATSYLNFDPEIDCYPGAVCKTILCFPIRDHTGIIGVGQLTNKVGDPYFDLIDEEMAIAFSVYCGVCIAHSFMYERIHEAHIRNSLANEQVIYHMKVSDKEVSRLLECSGHHSQLHLNSLHFNVRALPVRELPCYVLRMFSELGYDKKFNIRPQKLARFVLHVKKGYRDVPYHNWLHAFSVAQYAFSALVTYKLVANGFFSDLQGLMYVIAGLVHDMDHRGTTNNFQIQGQTTLAALYTSDGSVLERHHLAQAICVLNTEGCDILAALPRRDYDRAIMLLKDYVLATDLGNYFKNISDYKIIAYDFRKGNRTHITALQSLLMNAADLSDQIKDWGTIKKSAVAVLTEFFRQGDVEKSRGELPITFMDREKCFIPDLQIQFLTMTCIPLYETLGKIIPKALQCLKIVEKHIERWEAARSVFAEVPLTAGMSMLTSPELDDLIDKSLKEKELQHKKHNCLPP